MNPDRVSLFEVPLVCPAAPDIGCGSLSKPLLADLERENGVAETWLNSAGTVLAVAGGEDSSRETRESAVRSILGSKGMAANELGGDARERRLADFASGSGWYRNAAVDELSRKEAGIIGARLVRRVQAKIPLSEEAARTLAARITGAFVRRSLRDRNRALRGRSTIRVGGRSW